MSFNRTIIRMWTAKVVLGNGQQAEIDVRAKTIKEVRGIIKQDANVAKVASVQKTQ